MNISVIYFSVLREIAGKRQEQITLAHSSSADDLCQLLVGRYPGLAAYRSLLRLAVNEVYQPFDTILQPDDEVVFITPVSGG